MKTFAPIHMTVQSPDTDSGKEALRKRTAEAHAAFVHDYIRRLPCTRKQKRNLMDEIIRIAAAKNA